MQSLGEWMSSWDREPLASPGELALASRVSGVLWLSGAVTLLLTLALPGARRSTRCGSSLVIAAIAVVSGVLMLSPVPWAGGPVRRRTSRPCSAWASWPCWWPRTGSEDSPALAYLWFFVVYSAFFSRRASAGLRAGERASCSRCRSSTTARGRPQPRARLVVVVPDLLPRRRRRRRRPRALAGACAGRARSRPSSARRPPSRPRCGAWRRRSPPAPRRPAVFALVSSEAGRLLGGDGAAIARYEEGDRVPCSASGHTTSRAPSRRQRPRSSCPAACSAPALGEADRPRGSPTARRAGCAWRRRSHAAPAVGRDRPRRPPATSVPARRRGRLPDYAELVATAIANAEERARLDTQAGSTRSPGC